MHAATSVGDIVGKLEGMTEGRWVGLEDGVLQGFIVGVRVSPLEVGLDEIVGVSVRFEDGASVSNELVEGLNVDTELLPVGIVTVELVSSFDIPNNTTTTMITTMTPIEEAQKIFFMRFRLMACCAVYC
jgi:hypothetical protein